MEPGFVKKLFWVVLAVVAGLFAVRYLLPIALPFGFGALIAFSAEPGVRLGVNRLRLKRGVASVISVTLTLLLAAGLTTLLGAFLVRELGKLIDSLPNLQAGTRHLEDQLLSLADRSPEGIRPMAQRTVINLFEDGDAVMDRMSEKLPGFLTALVSGLGSSLLGIGTAILSAFLFSMRLPQLTKHGKAKLEQTGLSKYLPVLRKFRHSFWGWLKAQGKLAGITWGILTLGFWILKVKHAPAWAALVALVDAIPILGTGAVLLPWSLLCFFQGNTGRGAGLLVLYAHAATTRTVLEPRLVGKHLDLDPLTTLGALYTGFCLWGIPGLLLTPILASAIKSVLTANTGAT